LWLNGQESLRPNGTDDDGQGDDNRAVPLKRCLIPAASSHNGNMTTELTDQDKGVLADLLCDTIAADRFPLSPHVRRWQAILDKLEPLAPRPAPRP
jgi:hypothetical protein